MPWGTIEHHGSIQWANIMNQAEWIAKHIVDHVLPNCTMRFRAEQGHGEHDFDLICGGNIVAAIEVTMATDQQKRQMYARIRNAKYGGHFVQAKLCRRGWIVYPARSADPKRIRERIDAYLAPIEEVGIERFSASTDAYNNPLIYKIFNDLQIDAGETVNWTRQKNLICIDFPSDGGYVKIDCLREVLIQEINKKDNLRKLANVDSNIERHLFIHIDQHLYIPWKVVVDLDELDLPGLPAIDRIPQEMTQLWVSAETRSAGEYVSWTMRKGSSWQGPTDLSIVKKYL
jgi:hypothetical protein